MEIRPKELEEVLAFNIANRFPTMIVGQPGIGKTEIVRQAAGKAGAELIIMHPVVADPTDFKGFPFPVGDGTASFMPFGDLNGLIRAKKLTVCFLDDLGQAAPSVQAAAMQLVLERRINGHKVSDNVVFIAATNRKSDKAGVTGVLEPVKSRFNICHLTVSKDDWVDWAMKNGIDDRVIGYILFRPEVLSSWTPKNDIVNGPSPRTIEAAARKLKNGLSRNLWLPVISGDVGEEIGREMVAFFELMDDLPSLKSITDNPQTAVIPTRLDIRWAVTAMLMSNTNKDNIKQITAYMKRMPMEFQVSFFMTMNRTHRWFTLTPPVIEWIQLNSNHIAGMS